MVDPSPLLFVDTETLGLHPDLHAIWEVAAIRRDIVNGEEHEEARVWHLPVDLSTADPMALAIGRFHERYRGGRLTGSVQTQDVRCLTPGLPEFARDFMRFAQDCHLVGAVVSFDEERLRRLLRANGACESWHYHVCDVEAMAVGWLRNDAIVNGDMALHDLVTPPWNSADLTKALGIDPDQFDKHTALGDAKWARAIYDMVMGTPDA